MSDCALMKSLGKSQSEKSLQNRKAHSAITRYLERNRGNRQYRHAPSAGWSTGKVLKPLTKKFGPGRNALQGHWPEIVGEKWAMLSRPKAITGTKTGKTLVIEAKGPVAALMQANSGQYLAKINQFLGQGTVTKIIVKQGYVTKTNTLAAPQNPQPTTHMHSTLENTTQNRLQQALDNLGNKVKTRKRTQ